MKTINVVAAIIIKDNKIFICQRGPGRSLAGYYEFPGGKIENGETHQQALIREIKEELKSEISVDKYFMTVEHDYETFHLTMHTYLCTLLSGELILSEHANKAWCFPNELEKYEFAPADKPIIDKLKQIF